MGKTARLVLKLVAAGLAFCSLVCLIIGSWCDVGEAIERRRKQRLAAEESRAKSLADNRAISTAQ